jgi:cell division protein FtsL
MKKTSIIIIVLIAVVSVLSIAKTIMYNSFSTAGVEIDKIEKDISSYKTENSILSEKLLVESSLMNIASRAAEIGFEESDSVVFDTSSKLAVKR